jgi:septum formation protein
MPPLILASASPRRRELLRTLGLPFRTAPSDDPETTDPGLDAEAHALLFAERKAHAIAANLQHGLVLGADTIVALDAELLGKPVDNSHAAAMLRLLSGREHRVITGLALLDAASGAFHRAAVTSAVHFRPLSDDEIAAYLATGEPRDKAGAYAIQGLGGQFVTGVNGCYMNVVGLPLCETARMLTAAGLPIAPDWPGCRLADGKPCPRTEVRPWPGPAKGDERR